MGFEVFYSASGEGACRVVEKRAGGCEGGKEAVVWCGLIGVGVGGCVCLGVGLAVAWADAIFGDVCHIIGTFECKPESVKGAEYRRRSRFAVAEKVEILNSGKTSAFVGTYCKTAASTHSKLDLLSSSLLDTSSYH